jgi:hypothetical protein
MLQGPRQVLNSTDRVYFEAAQQIGLDGIMMVGYYDQEGKLR